MKKYKILIFCFFLICALLLCSCFGEDNGSIIISDITQYQGDLHESWGIFPKEIPHDAVNATYFYHRYFHDMDIYLELHFENIDAMQRYLTSLLERNSSEPFVEKESPFRTAYKDIWYGAAYSKKDSGEDYGFSYYEIAPTETGVITISGSYKLISYSYEDLTVISTLYGGVRYVEENPSILIPRYLQQLPLDWEHGAELRVEV